MSDADELKAILWINVTANAGNTPGQYETTLLRPPECQATGRSLLSTSYLSWLMNVHCEYVAAAVTLIAETKSSLMMPIVEYIYSFLSPR